jgi:hypothetical protein
MVYSLASEYSEGAKGRCDDNIHGISAWATAHAVADEVEVPCREAGLTSRMQNAECRMQNISLKYIELQRLILTTDY